MSLVKEEGRRERGEKEERGKKKREILLDCLQVGEAKFSRDPWAGERAGNIY